MSTWNASNYKQRKAARLLQVKPEWVINPETNEEFYLRKVGGIMSSVLAGYMPSGLTAIAAESWQEEGVEGLGSEAVKFAATLTEEQKEAGKRETASLAAIIQQACVIPFLSNQIPAEVQLTDEWKAEAAKGMKEKDPKFVPESFDFRELIFNPKDLDDKDSTFLFAWARGIAGGVSLKGGNVVSAANFSQVRKKLNRGSRRRSDGGKILQTA